MVALASVDLSSARAASNGTTAVDIVAAPASNHRIVVKTITVTNQDTVVHGVTIIYNDSGTARNLTNGTAVKIQPSESLVYEVIQVLETTTSKIQVKLTEGHTTTACDIIACWADYS